ncbi:Type IV fimbrial assembly, ATPase PilB [Candidatus Syntrophocurvum alkaliphilum]|uniref:Type IV fimbrial assembly, ATPase PilB n=1 Tax=Candidatus Syntrophocurvum alkaliphilum TaxID=2293317 RepID=A0A6I6D6Y9_9FIRM|nr:GspE/PulE family protein [Candidatus Syntrophocurvum alkaliphilum]QGT98933.1 Type IV fimbrial assembly, ATPase PilB [Candidatus Syntrophocurvum alkaliphilum]
MAKLHSSEQSFKKVKTIYNNVDFNYRYEKLSSLNINPQSIKLVPNVLLNKYNFLPISLKENTLIIAVTDPYDLTMKDEISIATGMEVELVIVEKKDLERARKQYLVINIESDINKSLSQIGENNNEAYSTLKKSYKLQEDAPIVSIVSTLMIQAVQGQASDIHIEPQKEEVRVRFRIDGHLHKVLSLPKSILSGVISRLKILADMDIAEKRIAQDGHINMTIEEREVDFRISTLPTIFGEKAVIRILDKANAITQINSLGLSEKNRAILVSLCQRPHGLVLVTGPTGCGKTTTLYSMLNEITDESLNIITLEDPVEFCIEGINQVQINPKAGLTFSSGLRSILRQDPNVIMVGEIRDYETAQLSVQAALTGHLVLSTLHTNSAALTVARLADIQIENFLLASCLAGVVSQRLVRKLCPNCSESYILDEHTAIRLGIREEAGAQFYRAKGCSMCRNLGYYGRIALQEIMIVGKSISDEINKGNTTENLLEKMAIEEGMSTIKSDGVTKAKQGITSLEEVLQAVLLESS